MNASPTGPKPNNALVEPAAGAVGAATAAIGNAMNSVKNAAVNATKAANTALNNAAKAANSSNITSVLPFGNNSRRNSNATGPKTNGGENNSMFNNLFGSNNGANAGKNAGNAGKNASKSNNSFNIFGNDEDLEALPANASAAKKNNSGGLMGMVNSVNMAAASAAKNFSVEPSASPLATPLGIFIALVVVFLVVFSVFNKQIKQGYEYIMASLSQALGLSSRPAVVAEIAPSEGQIQELTMPPTPPQDVTPSQDKADDSIVEKLLPSSAKNEVFNVSQNKFTYYDAEPLCKALGAELATYEQVKEAWNKGADWCNYGWVKGQMAVYPTQKGTYDMLQAGPEDQRNACGTVGLNGGVFDNPELRYGVNCYGKKPSQSAHDEALLMQQGKVPVTPDSLKVNEKINEYKSEADSLFVRPFNDSKWSTAFA
jgi:hypothetical protein